MRNAIEPRMESECGRGWWANGVLCAVSAVSEAADELLLAIVDARSDYKDENEERGAVKRMGRMWMGRRKGTTADTSLSGRGSRVKGNERAAVHTAIERSTLAECRRW